MSDSESENYESADEEYEEKIKKEEKFETPSKILNVQKSEKQDKDSKISKLNDNISTISTKNNEQKNLNTITISSKKQENVSKKVESIAATTDGWDIDDWGADDDDEDTNDVIKETHKSEKVSRKKTDQWDDFDDWEDSSKINQKVIQESSKDTQNPKQSENASASNKTSQLQSNLSTNLEKQQQPQSQQQSSWVWKPWGGVVSLLSTATEGVTTLSSQVSSVIEKSMGVPSPEEIAKINVQQNNENENVENQDLGLPSLGSIVTGVTSIGNKVISGGLDTLEEIGKKTMNILQENDPLLLNKRKLLGLENEKPNLSQILREAKEKSEEIEKNLKQMQKQSYKRQLHFETLFDHYYGLVHLEALEMLSKQSQLKLQSLLEPLTGNARIEMEETLNEVKELCELTTDTENDENDGLYDTEELKLKFLNSIEDLGIKIDFNEILKCWKENIEWLTTNDNNSEIDATQIYEHGLRCLAETCALSMLKLHKIAELLLIKEHHSTANEADALVQLTNLLCYHLNGVANRFGSKLNNFERTDEVNSMITSLFVEVGNSTSYVQSAFQLFIPILQIGAA